MSCKYSVTFVRDVPRRHNASVHLALKCVANAKRASTSMSQTVNNLCFCCVFFISFLFLIPSRLHLSQKMGWNVATCSEFK